MESKILIEQPKTDSVIKALIETNIGKEVQVYEIEEVFNVFCEQEYIEQFGLYLEKNGYKLIKEVTND